MAATLQAHTIVVFAELLRLENDWARGEVTALVLHGAV